MWEFRRKQCSLCIECSSRRHSRISWRLRAGCLADVEEGLGGPLPNHVFITVHNHLIVVGFFLMIVMGVAYWMFPRQAGTTPREAARDPLAWAGYVSLNTGLLMRAFVEPFATGETHPCWHFRRCGRWPRFSFSSSPSGSGSACRVWSSQGLTAKRRTYPPPWI